MSSTGSLELHGRIMPASNATFLGDLDGLKVVYKPITGERPLWDFPDGTLAGRVCGFGLFNCVFVALPDGRAVCVAAGLLAAGA